MNCQACKNLISAYIDSELSGEQMRRMREHLSRCPECEAGLEEFKAVQNLVRDLPTMQPPEGFEDRILAFVESESSRAPVQKRWTVVGLVAVASAAAAVAAFFAFSILSTPAPAMATGEQSNDRPYMGASDPFSPHATAASRSYGE
jgi:anti-sigma factor RsiW